MKTILADALEHPSLEGRTAYLKRSCKGDTTLMREVEELLALSTENLDELADNTPVAFTRTTPAQPSGRRIGAYEIVREIGRGGMGAVYLAKRADGQFEKQVAIKLLKRGTDTDEILRRFHAERRILAQLDHPNIARLIDAGTTDDGLPYFVMEHVAGAPITSYVREAKLSVARRLQLFLKVCEAVQFAHQRLVVHRDLKPGNILVTRDGEPKLLDFGIAKLLASEDGAIEVTLTAERRFTPVCASPEQIRGEPVTPATDAYALGALLYELLTEISPHRFGSGQTSAEEIARVICEIEPARPSLAAIDEKRRRSLRGDLDRIVLTALRKEPDRRYDSIAAFSDDITRHLEGRPIKARKGDLSYRAGRIFRRHKRALAAAITLAALGAVAGILLSRYSPGSSFLAATAPDKAPTRDLVAYDLYLRGNALMDDIATSTDWEGDNRHAIELLDRAVTHDPGFALAYARLSELHLNLYQWVDQTESRLAQAKAALQQAMRLAPDAPETHIAEALSATATGDCKHALDLLRGVQRERPDDAFVFQQIGQAEECVGMWREGLQDMERAKQLAPRNSNIPNQLKEMYTALRDYENSDRVCDDAIAQFPNGPNYYRAQKVANSLARGDTKQARARLAEIPEKFDPSGYRSLLSLTISFAERDFDRFTREVANTPWEHFIGEMKMRGDFMRALVAEHQRNRPLLESIVLPLREKLADRKEPPGRRGLSPAPSVLGDVARIDCYLDRTNEALRESEQAVATRTAPVDAPGAKLVRAEVLMRAGETDHALELLEELATVPYGPSYGDLLGPRWDTLRDDPHFNKIVASLASSR
ncbi:MAG: eukaryotic-like serine/threonine-protein kinase [Verrucomicrobiota bacterium]